jgi:hypothetical protein
MRGKVNDLLRALVSIGICWAGRLLRVRHSWRVGRFSGHQRALHRRYGLGPSVPIVSHGAPLQALLEAHAGPGVAYASTSGSSGLPKQIPYTTGRVAKVKAVYMDAFCRAFAALGIRRTSLYVFSSLKRDASLTALMMAETRDLPPYVSSLQAPYRVHSHPEMEALCERYSTTAVRLWVLVLSRPGCLYATNPSTLSVFMDTLQLDWESASAMVRDWVGEAPFADAVHRIARRLESDGSGARLRAVATADSPMGLAQCIPGLELICCWDGGYVRPALQRVLDRLPAEVKHLPMYAMSTETVETVPHFGGEAESFLGVSLAFLPLAPSVCCELLPVGEAALPGNLLGPEELESGAEYSLVVSDPHGLRRYHTEDVFECRGHVRGVPDLRFKRRLGLSYSFTGEKLTGDHVTVALAAVREAHPVTAEIPWMVCIPSQPAGARVPRYRLMIGLRQPVLLELESIATTFDAALGADNPEYGDKRASARLGPVLAESMDFEELVARVGGQRHAESWETQFKFLPFVSRTWESLK